jgi:hypothetical protein
MSKARNLSDFISDATIDSTEIADLSVTHAKLHTDMNLSSKTLTFAANQISGNSVDGGVISNFTSTGIDDNASATSVTILSGGNVGINSTNPSAKLTVEGTFSVRTSSNQSFNDSSNANNLTMTDSKAHFNIDGADKDFQVSSDTVTHALFVRGSDGKVGIGVTSPDNRLVIASGSDGTGNGDGIAFYGSVSNKQAAIESYNVGGYNSDLRFYTGNKSSASTTVTERMQIDSSGNVGIGGTAVPSSTAYNSATLHLRQVGSSSAGSQLRFTSGNSGHTNTDGGFISYWADNNFYLNNQETGDFRFFSGGSERTRVRSNGSFEIGYAGAALQQADSQAMTITTPASGGGQGIAIKRLDSNSDQQIGEITFSNNTQDGQAGIRVKTQGAVNTTDMHFDVNNSGGAVTSALKIDGSQGGKISIVSREMSIQGMELRHGTFGIGNYNRRVEIQLGNYESAHVRIMAQRTNGGSCLVYWEGYINNNNNAGYSTTIASRTSDGTVNYSFSVSGGNYRWDFNASGSSGDGSFVVQGARGGGSINITTW